MFRRRADSSKKGHSFVFARQEAKRKVIEQLDIPLNGALISTGCRTPFEDSLVTSYLCDWYWIGVSSVISDCEVQRVTARLEPFATVKQQQRKAFDRTCGGLTKKPSKTQRAGLLAGDSK